MSAATAAKLANFNESAKIKAVAGHFVSAASLLRVGVATFRDGTTVALVDILEIIYAAKTHIETGLDRSEERRVGKEC